MRMDGPSLCPRGAGRYYGTCICQTDAAATSETCFALSQSLVPTRLRLSFATRNALYSLTTETDVEHSAWNIGNTQKETEEACPQHQAFASYSSLFCCYSTKRKTERVTSSQVRCRCASLLTDGHSPRACDRAESGQEGSCAGQGCFIRLGSTSVLTWQGQSPQDCAAQELSTLENSIRQKNLLSKGQKPVRSTRKRMFTWAPRAGCASAVRTASGDVLLASH